MEKKMRVVYAKVRLTPEEMRDLNQQARTMGTSRAQLMRLLLTGDQSQREPSMMATQDQDQDQDQQKQLLQQLQQLLQKETEKMRGEIIAAFDEILKKLTEIIRVPTFTEFRARRVAEGDASRPGETQLDYVTRIAKGYYDAYGIWPTPEDGAKFGRLDDDIKAKFPRRPPK